MNMIKIYYNLLVWHLVGVLETHYKLMIGTLFPMNPADFCLLYSMFALSPSLYKTEK